MKSIAAKPGPRATRERYHVLRRIEEAASIPLSVLAFVWLALVVASLAWPALTRLKPVTLVIWGI
ncbi:MAG: hypothetical protein JO263_10330, partial [Candidatus Eremiobacteraeota bacterium]|nr:hypothetical protein [Candidatus Eremiobacteraeota bacterium]